MMTSRSVRRPLLTIAAIAFTSAGLTATAAPKKPKVNTSAPDRIVVTEDAPAAVPEPTPVGPARPMTSADATGTVRAPGEPRMITGSFIPQKFDLYANDTNAPIPLQIFKASDLVAKGRQFAGSNGGVVAPNYTSSMASTAMRPTTPGPEFVRVRTRHVLDLRTIEPARRLEVSTQLLGRERGRKFVSDFNQWEAARKKRLAAAR